MPQQKPSLPVEMMELNARAGNGAVPTGVYTLLVPVNYKRRWFSIQVPTTEADSLLLVITRGEPGVGDYGQMIVEPGQPIVLSQTNGMPWQGAVWATGTTADSYCYWTEVEDWP